AWSLLERGTSKNKDGRTFYLTPELRACLEASAPPQRCFSARRGESCRGCSTAKGRPSRASGRRGRPPARPPGQVHHFYQMPVATTTCGARMPSSNTAPHAAGDGAQAARARSRPMGAATLLRGVAPPRGRLSGLARLGAETRGGP